MKYGKSVIKPTSVHKLRPGDIDVIAAMGDSLVAGNGALEDWALGTMIENRGVSWCAGNYYHFCAKYFFFFTKKTFQFQVDKEIGGNI